MEHQMRIFSTVFFIFKGEKWHLEKLLLALLKSAHEKGGIAQKLWSLTPESSAPRQSQIDLYQLNSTNIQLSYDPNQIIAWSQMFEI